MSSHNEYFTKKTKKMYCFLVKHLQGSETYRTFVEKQIKNKYTKENVRKNL